MRSGAIAVVEQQSGQTPEAVPQQDRWSLIWGISTYGMLVVALCFCLADGSLAPTTKALGTALAALWGAWYWLFVARVRSWRSRIAIRVVSTFLSVLVAAAMSFCHRAFVLLLFSYYGIAFGALPFSWALPVAVLSSLCLAARFMDFGPGASLRTNALFVAGFLGMAFLDGLLGLFVSSIVRQSRERQRTIRELEAARSSLATAEREAGALAERQRLAGEIHDTLAQGFTGIILQLENAVSAMEPGQGAAREAVRRALDMARDSLAEARRTLWALRPDLLEREPFPAALARVVERWSRTSGVAAETTVTGTASALPPAIEVTLLRAAQEGLANVAKHAAARQVAVTLSYMSDEVAMDIQDDGRGFDPAAPGRNGYGLHALRERAEGVGGRLLLESLAGEGTTLVLQIPVPQGGAREEPK